ncbi:sulfate transporter family-domain-containing protein [Apodospora peruviana]|uniref:Sulfate transporter family-domain-containing protein n=1 Tax=Apodospora peruviana TaxID=516989 RepID=A0AAE0LYG7_9PEZI|nr:sulfate transporter family-domain-containing protein [Apodospora peruviana]
MASTTLGDRVKRFLGIDPEDKLDDSLYFHEDGSFIESEPSTAQFLRELRPTVHGVVSYFRELFPFLGWIFHYNLTWLLGDFIAGVTVGFVVVPQGMAYAGLANLDPEYGLYTSFVGFLLYWAFATSKDITIGAVAVMSTIVGNIIIDVQGEHPEIPAETIARSLALISGAVLLFLGLVRMGWIVEFIPLVAIASFMTGSAISIAAGQVPTLMGIKGINNRESTYIVIINTLKALPKTKLDAAMGLTALFGLYFIRWFCNLMGRRYPSRQKTWFFISTLRMAFIIIIYILVSWLVNRGLTAEKAKFKILGTVPSGFQHTGAPDITIEVLQAIASDIPLTIIVLLIEHIAISKSFGRVNNYIINPSQELVALGFTNVFGPFLGGYPSTGSFSRTAIKAKAGVRTPLAGIFTAVIVLLALYALTSVFFFIPSAALAGLIIHAVGDLITPPREVYKFWQTSPVEVVIFFAGVLVSIFSSIENGIYTTVGVSGGLLLFRIAKSPGRFLGKIDVYTTPRDTVRANARLDKHDLLDRREGSAGGPHTAYIALDKSDLSNPELAIKQPYPGVFVYRFGEGLNYINSARHLDNMIVNIYKLTRKTEVNKFERLGDRPWNDPGPRRGKTLANEEEIMSRPTLRAVVLDFSAVNFLDVTAAQALVDLRNQFNRYAAPDTVEWHFAGVANRWTKRALVASGFGADNIHSVPEGGAASGSDGKRGTSTGPLLAVGDAVTGSSGKSSSEVNVPASALDEKTGADRDIEAVRQVDSSGSKGTSGGGGGGEKGRLVPVFGINRPYFHVDVATAVRSAVRNLEGRGEEY